jgi:hypothetical protein
LRPVQPIPPGRPEMVASTRSATISAQQAVQGVCVDLDAVRWLDTGDNGGAMSVDERNVTANAMSLLLVVVPDPELDGEASERLTRQLRAEIAKLDVESVGLATGGGVPDGAKAADPVTVGAIVVALSASGGVFHALVETLRDWLARHGRAHRISMTIDGDSIEVDRASAEQQRALVDAFVRRHSTG